MNAIASATDVQIRGSPATSPLGTEPTPVRPSPALSESPPAAGPPDQEPPEHAVEQAADGVNAFLRSSGNHIQFAVHKQTNRVMVEVVDDHTQEIIRTIPSKELLDLAGKIGEMVGLFLDKKG